MNKRKIVYIIPGYRHTPENKAYKEISKILRKEGFMPQLINISWKQTTISQNTEYFLKKYKEIHSRNKYILGFSFGAMIAILASTKVNTKGLILCSLSPFFKEDIKRKPKNISVSLFKDLTKLKFKTIAKQVKSQQIHMLYGAREDVLLKKRVTQTYNVISSKNKNLISIKKVDHNLGNKNYLHSIHQVAKLLN